MKKLSDERLEELEEKVLFKLKDIYDPEIPVNIYDLGLIYEVEIYETGQIYVMMTLTSPMCPVAESLPLEVEDKLLEVPDITQVDVDVVWDPPWNREMMSEEAKLQLNLM